MNTLTQRPPKQKKRSPLGWQVAGVLTGELDTLTTMRQVAGELGERIVRAFCHVRWSELVGDVRFYAAPQHDPNETCVRIACAHALKALERTSTENRRACSSALFRGHTHRITEDGERVYVPGAQAGGLAARLKRCPRTLDRHCQVLEAAGIADVWQPPGWDVPKSMRGAEYAYAVYEWRSELPRELVDVLVQWWGTAAARQLSAQRQRREERAAPALGAAERRPASEAGRALAARLLGALEPPS